MGGSDAMSKPIFRAIFVREAATTEVLSRLEDLLANGFILNDTVRVTDDCVLLILRKN